MLPLRIAWRFLVTSKAQSILIVGGIAVGIAVQVFVGSLITSLQANLIDQTIGSSPHVIIADPTDGEPVEFSDLVRRALDRTGNVTAIAPVRQVSALYTVDSDRVPLNITGGSLPALDGIYRVREKTVAGSASLANGRILIGVDLARKYGLEPGDPMRISTGSGSPLTLTVAGIVDLGSSAANLRTAFTGPEMPQTVLGYRSDQYSAVQVRISDPFSASSVASGLRQAVPGTKVTDWQSENKDLLTALQSQSASSYMIQAFVLVAVALGIASTLAISAVQKTRQIGILKALGMADGQTARVFVWESAILGVAGTAIGIALGWFLTWGFTLGTAQSPAGFPITLQPSFIAISASVGLVVALLSSIIPSRATGRLDPIEVIQNG